MSHSSKADNAANAKQGAFNPSAPRGEPMTTKGVCLTLALAAYTPR